MYALREYLGEDAVNRALAQYIRDVGFQEPPFTNSVEFVEAIRAETPDKYAYLIEDLFETITLYDNRVTQARAREGSDGKWEVELSVTLAKLRADDKGVESPIDMSDWIQVGAFDAQDRPLGLQLMHFEQGAAASEPMTVTFTVDDKPARAGVDPNVLLIDRNPDDNVRTVEPW